MQSVRPEVRQEERAVVTHERAQREPVRVRLVRRKILLQIPVEEARAGTHEGHARVSHLQGREAVQGQEGTRAAHDQAQAGEAPLSRMRQEVRVERGSERSSRV